MASPRIVRQCPGAAQIETHDGGDEVRNAGWTRDA
jgi:hypothetical protein